MDVERNRAKRTQVVFRKFQEGEVIALFPNDVCDQKGMIQSYMHIGQHGAASPELIQDLEVAAELECKALKVELMSIGYDLEPAPALLRL